MAGAPQQGGQPDNSTGILWGVAALFAAIGVIWVVFKTKIVSVYLLIKLGEVDALNAMFHSDYFDQLRNLILTALAHPTNVTFNQLMYIGGTVGSWLRFPFVIFLFILAIIVYFNNTTRVFKHTYNMQDLAKLEKINWPQITPVTHLNLIKADIDSGPWAMAMTPLQFCKRYRLLEEIHPKRREGMSRKEWDKIEVILRRGETNKLFALQLGQAWRGIDKLPPYARALFAVFAARINADTQSAAKLIMQLNASSDGKMNYAGVTELIKKHEKTKLVQAVMQSHAYALTVMAGMLERARDDGVQASADFLWLKPLDRRMWYTLNMVGRQTPFVEVAGVFAHWVAEKHAGRRLAVPMVEEATKALEAALKEVVYRPDEKPTEQ
jgi:intracellular multiplication protein IcmP